MPDTGETPHHIPGNPSPGECSTGMSDASIDPSANVPGNPSPSDIFGLAGPYTVADQPKYAVRGNPEPGSVMG